MLEPEKIIAKGQMEDELMFTEWLPSAECFIGVTTFNSTTTLWGIMTISSL